MRLETKQNKKKIKKMEELKIEVIESKSFKL